MQEREGAIEFRLCVLRAADREVHLAERMAGMFQFMAAHRAAREQAGRQYGCTERVADNHARTRVQMPMPTKPTPAM